MIGVIYGTTGELIKLGPVLRGIQERGGRFLNLTTAQQVTQIPGLLVQFELPQPNVYLAHGRGGRDLERNADIPIWFSSVARRFVRTSGRLKRELQSDGKPPLVLVHGDTMTTVLGACMGRLLGAPVAHIESGLRSFDLRHPFPEELNRRLTSKVASIHYAPGAWAAGNLTSGEVVNTGSNTIADSLALSLLAVDAGARLPSKPFGLVSLHRFELLKDKSLLRATLELLADAGRRIPLIFVDHPVTVAAIDGFGLTGLFDDQALVRVPRMSFFEFVPLMRRSSFIVTDSGGSQEESFHLDVPCLVHRKRTERQEGVGENVVVSGLDQSVLARFLADPTIYRRRTPPPSTSPTAIILDDLASRGHL